MRRTPRVVLVQSPTFVWYTPSNSLALVGAHLKRGGVAPVIHDASMSLYKKLSALKGWEFEDIREYMRVVDDSPGIVSRLLDEEVETILSHEPDLVGFSVLTYTERWSLELAERIKRRDPRCRVLFGGSQCMKDTLADEFIRHPWVDAVVLGEADISLMQFLEAFEPGARRLPVTPGVLVREGEQVLEGPEPEVVQDLDTLPFMDFSGFQLDDYVRDRIFMSTSRGCVRKCSFCTYIIQQKTFRTMSPARVVSEIRHQMRLYRHRCQVEFTDALINGNIRNLGEMCRLLADYRAERLLSHRGLDFAWTALAIFHNTLTPALLSRMRQSGCRALRYGLESGSQRVVDLMRKNFKLPDAERVVRDTHKAGIESHLFILVGYPGEAEEDFQLTLDFVERNAKFITGARISTCDIMKGSHLDTHIAEYDIQRPLGDRVRWASKDGSNTYEVRQERARRMHALLAQLQMPVATIAPSKTGTFGAAVVDY